MGDANLIAFGCVVSFIALAGAYVYLRECFTAEEQPAKSQARRRNPEKERLRKVA